MLILRKVSLFLLLSFSVINVTTICAQPAKIYFLQGSATTSLDALFSANLDGSGLTTLASDAANFAQPGKIIVDKAAGYIYIADASATGAGIVRFNLNGTGRTVIIPPIASALMNGIAIDKAAGKLYYTVGSGTASLDALYSANLDGTGIQLLASGAGNFAQPADLQIDTDAGHIYVADASTVGAGILRYNLDGTGRTVIIAPVASSIYVGVALDLVNDRIYFTQGSATTSLDALKVANLDGSGITTLASDAANFAQPTDVYFDRTNSHLYVSDGSVSGAGILRFNLNGTGRTVIIPGNASSLFNGVSLDDPLITLPVHLISFSGRADNNLHLLEWVVEDEENFSHYELEQDKGNGFISVARITATGSRSYNYNQAVQIAGSYLYRLKMTDKDGSFTYSNAIRLDGRAPVTLQLYPNPSRDWVTASVDQPVDNIKIYNNKGQLVKTVPGSSNMVVGFSISDLSKGTYIVRVETKTQHYVKNLVVH